MTLKEAVAVLKTEKKCIERQTCDRDCAQCNLVLPTEEVLEAYEVAIKALEQEPCEDVISRQAAIDTFDCSIGGVPVVPVEALKYVIEYANKMVSRINALPPAQTEPLAKESRTLIKDLAKDAISRQAVLEGFEKYKRGSFAYGCVWEYVKNLPSVKPQYTDAEIQKMQELEQAEIEKAYELGKAEQPNVGRWILADEQNKEDVENDNYRFICSECQCSDIHAKGTKVPYCWKCGAKMVEPQESEDA